MKNRLVLIFDLDNTIFETRSIGQHHFASILDNFKATARQFYGANKIDLIISDLWQFPFDHVSAKYQFDELLKNDFSNSVNTLEYQLNIQTFDDYEHVKNIQAKKVLVTTGFKKLQFAKISALNIEDDFDNIYIDDINDQNRIHKKGIFKTIIDSDGALMDHVVIGDNPESELKAGHELGLTTIQVAKFRQEKSRYADFYLSNLKDLTKMLTQNEHNNTWE